MRRFYLCSVYALLLCGCGREQQNHNQQKREAAELVESKMAQFAAANNATVLTSGPTNWRSLTADIEDALKQVGKSVVVELIFPDVRRDELGYLVLEAEAMLHAPIHVRVEAMITTNMLPQVRTARSEIGGLWLVMNVESVRRRSIENDSEGLVLRGRTVAVEAHPLKDLVNHAATPGTQK